MTKIEEFKKKYGVKTFGLLIEAFITQAPEFEGDKRMAGELGKIVADLESVLEEVRLPVGRGFVPDYNHKGIKTPIKNGIIPGWIGSKND